MNKKIEEISASIKKNFKSWILNLALAGVSIAYVAMSILKWDKTNVSLTVAIGQGAVVFAFSVIIKTLLGEKGLEMGESNPQYLTKRTVYIEKSNLAEPFMDSISGFKEKEKAILKAKIRKVALSKYRIHYDAFFDENGEFINHDIMKKSKFKKELKKDKNFKVPEGVVVLDRKQRQILKKADKLEVHLPDLFTEYANDINIYTKKEKTDAQVRLKNNSKNIIFGFVFTFMSVYFAATIVFDPAKILSTLFTLGSFFGIGILQLYSNLNYVKVEKAAQIDTKDKLLTKFLLSHYSKEEYKSLMKEIRTRYDSGSLKKDEDFVEVEMTEDELKAKGLLKQ